MGMPRCPADAERKGRPGVYHGLGDVSSGAVRHVPAAVHRSSRGITLATSRILLVSQGGDVAVVEALRASGHETTVVETVESAIASGLDGSAVDVLVIDLDEPVENLVEASRALHAAVNLSALPILCVVQTDDIEDRIQLLEAGVDDVISRPFDPRELDARAEALGLRMQRSHDLGASGGADTMIRDGAHRRLIAFFSPKGGVGTTSLAVNVATWLAAERPGAVALLDLDFQFGQVTTHLNMAVRKALPDLLRDPTTVGDPALLTAALDRHGSGLLVLGAAATPEDAAGVSDSAVSTLLMTAAEAFPFVVIDAGSILDSRTEIVFARATDLVIVVTPEFPAIKSVHALGEMLAGGNGRAEISYVLNDIFARELLRLPDIEEALGTKVAIRIPHDGFAFLKSVNEGIPVVQGAPRSAAAAQLARLAAGVAGLARMDEGKERKSKGLGGLLRRG